MKEKTNEEKFRDYIEEFVSGDNELFQAARKVRKIFDGFRIYVSSSENAAILTLATVIEKQSEGKRR